MPGGIGTYQAPKRLQPCAPSAPYRQPVPLTILPREFTIEFTVADPREIIVSLAARSEGVSSGEAAERVGISRQAAHRHLRALVAKGTLEREGAGPATRYRLAERVLRFTWPTAGLQEDEVWASLRERAPSLGSLDGDARHVFGYAVTELVNNVVDHARAKEVEVRVRTADGLLTVEIIDEGIGIFEHVRRAFGLVDDLASLQEISKGKTTTDPEHHTGEGLFFTSKVADRFEIESGRLCWIVDNLRGDVGVGTVDPPRKGTRAVFSADPARPRSLRKVFEAHTDDHVFTRSRTVVKLFAFGTEFVSRSEAKRLVHGLEKFREVVVDFAGVEVVGQGFADEVFRVWHRAHPEVRLVPVNMNDAVAFMVERARGA
jgi:anti-sigma regulatory factor (Ser/Thr protein kinase)